MEYILSVFVDAFKDISASLCGTLVSDAATNEIVGIINEKSPYENITVSLPGKVRAMMKYRGKSPQLSKTTIEDWKELLLHNPQYFDGLPVDILIFHSYFVSDEYGFDSFVKLSEKIIETYSSEPEKLVEYVTGIEPLFEENKEVE